MSQDYTDIQVRLLVGSPGASTTQSDSPGPSMTPSYTSGPSTTPSYSLGPSRNAECANCKLLIGKLQVLEATLEMYMHPEKHTIDSTALLHELYNDMGKFRAQPHRALARLAWRFGPIVRLQLGEVSAILVSSPSVAKEIMKTHDLTFADRPKLLVVEIVNYNYTDIAFAPYGEYWRQMRKICILELLSAKKVRSFQSIRETESWNLVKVLANDSSKTVNLTEKIFTLMNTITCKATVGSRWQDQSKLGSTDCDSITLASGLTRQINNTFIYSKILTYNLQHANKLWRIRTRIDVIFDDVISDHQQRRAVGQNTEDNEDLLDDVFSAGTDTSAVTIEWTMSELMKNPRVMKKVQAEVRYTLQGKEKIHESDIKGLDYLKIVIMETLRLHPPLPLLLPRECRENCEIAGYNIPVKTKVIINMWKIARDPDYWTDPESFIPERFSESSINMMGQDFEYIPFGSGRRMCPGMTLGLANAEIALVMLLYHFNWELPNGARSEDLDTLKHFSLK
ncbi:cytochrome P450 71AV8 [Tanacetum coccineum]